MAVNSIDFENPAVENDILAAGNRVDNVETSVDESTALGFTERKKDCCRLGAYFVRYLSVKVVQR